MSVRVRPATADDLPACHAVWAGGPPPSAPPAEPNPLHRHELGTGTLLVAELDPPAGGPAGARIVGFGGSLTRGDRWYLADLFVEDGEQSAGVGRRLLDGLLVGAPADRHCAASDDLRGQALYVRAGMVPRWPIYELRATLPLPRRLPVPWLRAEPADPADPALAALDQELAGVDRRVDLAWLCGPARADALWLIDESGARQGYALVQRTSPAVLDPAWRSAATVVGVGARRATAATDAVVATIGWIAAAGRPAVRLLVPGPHPALATLLGAGVRIDGSSLYCASSERLFDPTRRLPSLSVL